MSIHGKIENMNQMFVQKPLNLEEIATDIAKNHTQSAFTNEQTLVNWIYTALQHVQQNATVIERDRSEKNFLDFLERQAKA